MMNNWKTTLAGIASLVTVAFSFVNNGNVSGTDIAAITAALGLLFAKDHNVTGGTKQQ